MQPLRHSLQSVYISFVVSSLHEPGPIKLLCVISFMASFSVFRALRSTIASPSIRLRFNCRRFSSNRPDHVNPEVAGKIRSRLTRLTSRLPRFLQRYTTPLISAPLTHISAFLLLHELTAVVPLFALAGIFHYTQWLPPYISEGKWISNGVEMFGSYFRRKGWLGDEEYARRHKWWGRGEGGVRVVIEYVPLRFFASIVRQ